MSEYRQKRHLTFSVPMGLSMLDIDHTDHPVIRWGHDRHREKCLVLIFRQRVKELEPRILARVTRNRNRLDFLGDPTGDALADPHRNLSNQARMWVFRSSQNQILTRRIDQVDETGVTMRYIDNQLNDLPEHLIQIQRRADGLADLVRVSAVPDLPGRAFFEWFRSNCGYEPSQIIRGCLTAYTDAPEAWKPCRRLPELPDHSPARNTQTQDSDMFAGYRDEPSVILYMRLLLPATGLALKASVPVEKIRLPLLTTC